MLFHNTASSDNTLGSQASQLGSEEVPSQYNSQFSEKSHMARRRRYGSIVSLPLGGLKNLIPGMSGSVNATDVLLGGAVGFVGVNLLDVLLNKVIPAQWTQVKTSLGKLLPLATGVATAMAVNLIGKKTRIFGSHTAGFAVGAVGLGVAMTAQNFLRGMAIPGGGGAVFSDIVALPMSAYNYGGLLVDNPQPMNGLLVDNPTPQRSNLAALGQLSLGDDEYDGMDALAAMG